MRNLLKILVLIVVWCAVAFGVRTAMYADDLVVCGATVDYGEPGDGLVTVTTRCLVFT